MLAPALVGGSGPVRLVTDRSGSDFEGIRLVVEALEPRVLLSIAASLAGPFQAA